MKRIVLAASLGLGILTFVITGANTSHATAPHSQLIYDTVPEDTTQPAPKTDSTTQAVQE